MIELKSPNITPRNAPRNGEAIKPFIPVIYSSFHCKISKPIRAKIPKNVVNKIKPIMLPSNINLKIEPPRMRFTVNVLDVFITLILMYKFK